MPYLCLLGFFPVLFHRNCALLWRANLCLCMVLRSCTLVQLALHAQSMKIDDCKAILDFNVLTIINCLHYSLKNDTHNLNPSKPVYKFYESLHQDNTSDKWKEHCKCNYSGIPISRTLNSSNLLITRAKTLSSPQLNTVVLPPISRTFGIFRKIFCLMGKVGW